MKPRSSLSLVAFVLSILALAASVSGGAYAVVKIGKNQVVTKSIKNGAVTAPKIKSGAVDGRSVRDGALGVADLAPGTLPVPASGKSVATASINNLPDGADVELGIFPVGPFTMGQSWIGLAPLSTEVADLHVLTSNLAIGRSVRVSLDMAPGLGNSTSVVACTVTGTSGYSSCASSQKGTIPAGTPYYIHITNGPGGGASGFISVGYTVRVP